MLSAFEWAVAVELVPPSTHHGLQAVTGLRRGRSAARESEPVKPVPEVSVNVSRQVWAADPNCWPLGHESLQERVRQEAAEGYAGSESPELDARSPLAMALGEPSEETQPLPDGVAIMGEVPCQEPEANPSEGQGAGIEQRQGLGGSDLGGFLPGWCARRASATPSGSHRGGPTKSASAQLRLRWNLAA